MLPNYIFSFCRMANCPCVQFGKWLFNYILQCPFLTCVAVVLLAVSVLHFLSLTTRIIKFLSKNCCGKGANCIKPEEWAVITGASDGIGKAMALELASQGAKKFILVARNQEKLKDTDTQLRLVGSRDIEVKCISLDYSTATSLEIFQTIQEAIKDIDVGLLINNVGISYPHAMYYDEVDPSFVDELISVNVKSTLITTRAVLPNMKRRNSGYILCIGSGASAIPSDPLYCAYAATKATAEAFCRSLKVECDSFGIGVQCHLPLLVTTKLSKCKTPSLMVPSAEKYAKCAVAALGTRCVLRSPYWVHALILYVSNAMPNALWKMLRLRQCVAIRKKAMKKQQGEKKDS